MSRERAKNVYSQLNEWKVGAKKYNNEGERIWVAYLTMEKVGLVGQMEYVPEKLTVEYTGKGKTLALCCKTPARQGGPSDTLGTLGVNS